MQQYGPARKQQAEAKQSVAKQTKLNEKTSANSIIIEDPYDHDVQYYRHKGK